MIIHLLDPLCRGRDLQSWRTTAAPTSRPSWWTWARATALHSTPPPSATTPPTAACRACSPARSHSAPTPPSTVLQPTTMVGPYPRWLQELFVVHVLLQAGKEGICYVVCCVMLCVPVIMMWGSSSKFISGMD